MAWHHEAQQQRERHGGAEAPEQRKHGEILEHVESPSPEEEAYTSPQQAEMVSAREDAEAAKAAVAKAEAARAKAEADAEAAAEGGCPGSTQRSRILGKLKRRR